MKDEGPFDALHVHDTLNSQDIRTLEGDQRIKPEVKDVSRDRRVNFDGRRADAAVVMRMHFKADHGLRGRRFEGQAGKARQGVRI